MPYGIGLWLLVWLSLKFLRTVLRPCAYCPIELSCHLRHQSAEYTWNFVMINWFCICLSFMYVRNIEGQGQESQQYTVKKRFNHIFYIKLFLLLIKMKLEKTKVIPKIKSSAKRKLSSLYWIWKKALRNSMVKSYILI